MASSENFSLGPGRIVTAFAAQDKENCPWRQSWDTDLCPPNASLPAMKDLAGQCARSAHAPGSWWSAPCLEEPHAQPETAECCARNPEEGQDMFMTGQRHPPRNSPVAQKDQPEKSARMKPQRVPSKHWPSCRSLVRSRSAACSEAQVPAWHSGSAFQQRPRTEQGAV